MELDIPINCKAFCEVCSHGVFNMEKHIQSEEHRRNLKKARGEFMGLEPRTPMPKAVPNEVSEGAKNDTS